VTDTTPRRPLRACCGALIALIAVALAGCSSFPEAPITSPTGIVAGDDDSAYLIGPADQLSVNVWHQAELSTAAIVRPDGKISLPLINDMPAAGRTPTALGDAIAASLKEFIQNPQVTVIVTNFVGPYDRQIRVLGEAARPQAIPFRRNMTVLDVMIKVGGLTNFASGNRATLTRASASGPKKQFRLRLDDLLHNGDPKANAYVLPGDIIVIPQTYF
jgi:polysaccharide export outer membrane protein